MSVKTEICIIGLEILTCINGRLWDNKINYIRRVVSLSRSSSKLKMKFHVEENLWMDVLTDDG